MSVSSRIASDTYQEELIRENEMMLQELDALRPIKAQFREAVAISQRCKDQLAAVQRENALLVREAERLRAANEQQQASVIESLETLLRETRAAASRQEVFFAASSTVSSAELQERLQQEFSKQREGFDSEMAEQRRVVSMLEESVAKLLSERDAAVERVAFLEKQWNDSVHQAQTLSNERNCLKAQAAEILAATGSSSAAIAELVSRIFDAQEAESAELLSKIAIREVQLADERQKHLQDVAALQEDNNSLSDRLHRALKHVRRGESTTPPAASPQPAVQASDADANTTGVSPPAAVHLTLSLADDGTITARRHHHSVDAPDAAVAASQSPEAAGRTRRLSRRDHTPQQATANTCPRCTYINPAAASICTICEAEL